MMNRSQCWVLSGLILFSLALVPKVGVADIKVRFEEDAPKDRFIFTNASDCDVTATLDLNLSGSRAGLIFDTVRGGAGENVAQPLEVAKGGAFLLSVPNVTDGARGLRLDLRELKSRSEIVVTIDVDDSIPTGPMGVQMISGSEMAGATIIADLAGTENVQAVFDDGGKAQLPVPLCS